VPDIENRIHVVVSPVLSWAISKHVEDKQSPCKYEKVASPGLDTPREHGLPFDKLRASLDQRLATTSCFIF
jgi:hypothetical protein